MFGLGKSLPWVTAVFLLSATTGWAQRSITVYPKNSKAFRCQVGPEQIPAVTDEGVLKLRVGVSGGAGPFYWRVPFRSWSNGENLVSLAQSGEEKSRRGTFTIALDATKLPMDSEDKKLELRLISRDGVETVCTTQIAVMEAAAKPTSLMATEASVR